MRGLSRFEWANEEAVKRVSLAWVIPIVALIVTVILLLHNVLNKGSTIYLTTSSAEGIEAGKTEVKLRSVTIGKVVSVHLGDSYDKVVIEIQMDSGTDELLRQDTVFWVVKPRIEAAGISGLETLFSGAYIQCHPGTSEEETKRFTLLEDLPPIIEDEGGMKIELVYSGTRKLSVGDAVEHKGYKVGAVLSSRFDLKADKIRYTIFVREPYTDIFNSSTRFWINSGIDISLGSGGFRFNTESVRSILQGGISFESLSKDELEHMEITTAELFENKNDAYNDYLKDAPSYVVFLDKVYRNLQVGSDIIYRGVKIGKVTKNPLVTDLRYLFNNSLAILFSLDLKDEDVAFVQGMLDEAIANQTICAHVDSSDILSANNQIQLSMESQCSLQAAAEDAGGGEVSNAILTSQFRGYKVIPLSQSSIDDEVGSILTKIQDLDTKGISYELKTSLRAFRGAMEAFRRSNNELHSEDLIQNMNKTFASLHKTLDSYGANADVYQKLNEVLVQVNKLLQDLNPAINEIGQKPNALIFSESRQDIIPRRGK